MRDALARASEAMTSPLTQAMPIRIQRKRTKGWKMPPNTVSVTRPGKHGNPFRVGGYFKVGGPHVMSGISMAWSERCIWNKETDPAIAIAEGYALIESAAQAVDLFRKLVARGHVKADDLRGKNLACFCRLDQPCHADVLLEIANG